MSSENKYTSIPQPQAKKSNTNIKLTTTTKKKKNPIHSKEAPVKLHLKKA